MARRAQRDAAAGGRVKLAKGRMLGQMQLAVFVLQPARSCFVVYVCVCFFFHRLVELVDRGFLPPSQAIYATLPSEPTFSRRRVCCQLWRVTIVVDTIDDSANIIKQH